MSFAFCDSLLVVMYAMVLMTSWNWDEKSYYFCLNDFRHTGTLRYRLKWDQSGTTWRMRTWWMHFLSRVLLTAKLLPTMLARYLHLASLSASFTFLGRIAHLAFLMIMQCRVREMTMMSKTARWSSLFIGLIVMWHHWVLCRVSCFE